MGVGVRRGGAGEREKGGGLPFTASFDPVHLRWKLTPSHAKRFKVTCMTVLGRSAQLGRLPSVLPSYRGPSAILGVSSRARSLPLSVSIPHTYQSTVVQ